MNQFDELEQLDIDPTINSINHLQRHLRLDDPQFLQDVPEFCLNNPALLLFIFAEQGTLDELKKAAYICGGQSEKIWLMKKLEPMLEENKAAIEAFFRLALDELLGVVNGDVG